MAGLAANYVASEKCRPGWHALSVRFLSGSSRRRRLKGVGRRASDLASRGSVPTVRRPPIAAQPRKRPDRFGLGKVSKQIIDWPLNARGTSNHPAALIRTPTRHSEAANRQSSTPAATNAGANGEVQSCRSLYGESTSFAAVRPPNQMARRCKAPHPGTRSLD